MKRSKSLVELGDIEGIIVKIILIWILQYGQFSNKTLFLKFQMHYQKNAVLKRTVKDQKGFYVEKNFKITSQISETYNNRILSVIDLQNFEHLTLKIIFKNEYLVKSIILNEIKNNKKMNEHQNFIKLKHVYEDNDHIYYLMDNWGVSLEEILLKKGVLMQRQVCFIFCQLVDILDNLRSKNMSHGSITLKNVFIKNVNNKYIIYLGGFNSSLDVERQLNFIINQKMFFKNAEQKTQKSIDNQFYQKFILQNQSLVENELKKRIDIFENNITEYTSPEFLSMKEKNAFDIIYSLFDKDIWSCGVILFKLLTGNFPIDGFVGRYQLDEKIRKIKNQSFCFPSVKNGNSEKQLLSVQWKQLLKKILSPRNSRITLKDLVSHKIRQSYFELKDVENLLNNHFSDLNNISIGRKGQGYFNTQKDKKINRSIYEQSWNVNYFEENEVVKDQENVLLNIDNGIEIVDKQIETLSLIKNAIESLEPQIKVRKISKAKSIKFNEESIVLNIQNHQKSDIKVKKYRIKENSKHVQNNNRQSIFKSKKNRESKAKKPQQLDRKIKNEKVIQTTKNNTVNFSKKQLQSIDVSSRLIIHSQPIFLLKIKYNKKDNYLGYLLNNSIGIVHGESHILGHTKNQYKILKNSLLNTRQNDNTQKERQTFKEIEEENLRKDKNYKEYTKNDVQRSKNMYKSSVSILKQFSAKNTKNQIPLDLKSSHPLVDKTSSSLNLENVSLKDKFNKMIDYFGERVVKSDLGIWVQKFWKQGNIFIFLLSNKCWQVSFYQKKILRIYAVDRFGLSWANQGNVAMDIIHTARNFIRKYRKINGESSI